MGQQVLDNSRADAGDRARAMSNPGRAFGLRYDAFRVQSDIFAPVDFARSAMDTVEDLNIRFMCKSNLMGDMISVAERNRTCGFRSRAWDGYIR